MTGLRGALATVERKLHVFRHICVGGAKAPSWRGRHESPVSALAALLCHDLAADWNSPFHMGGVYCKKMGRDSRRGPIS